MRGMFQIRFPFEFCPRTTVTILQEEPDDLSLIALFGVTQMAAKDPSHSA
jgi:hypothetical protein